MSQSIQKLPDLAQSLIPASDEWIRLKELCSIAAASGLIPIKDSKQALIIALKGRELNIPPMQAFSQISVVNGKPTLAAELQLSLIYRAFPDARINFIETTTSCSIESYRPHNPTAFKCSFSLEDAKNAGLLNKDSWKKYPNAMLRARAISIMARAQFPDALMGFSHTAEELGAEVTEEGEVVSNIVDITPSVEQTTGKVTEVKQEPTAPQVQEDLWTTEKDLAPIAEDETEFQKGFDTTENRLIWKTLPEASFIPTSGSQKGTPIYKFMTSHLESSLMYFTVGKGKDFKAKSVDNLRESYKIHLEARKGFK